MVAEENFGANGGVLRSHLRGHDGALNDEGTAGECAGTVGNIRDTFGLDGELVTAILGDDPNAFASVDADIGEDAVVHVDGAVCHIEVL